MRNQAPELSCLAGYSMSAEEPRHTVAALGRASCRCLLGTARRSAERRYGGRSAERGYGGMKYLS